MRDKHMRRTLVIFAIVAALAAFFFALPEPKPAAQPGVAGGVTNTFALRGVRVFDGARVIERATVIVRGGRIEAVVSDAAPQDGDAVAGLDVVDGTGKTLLPGFIDAHTHSYGTALHDAVRFGVTTSLDMFATPTTIRDHRARRDTLARSDAADLFSAGLMATVDGGHGTQFGIAIPTLRSVDEVPAWVDARIAEGSDYIKIAYEPGIPWVLKSVDEPMLRALVQTTHGRGHMAVVHISRLRPAKEALRAGANGLVHLFADKPVDDEFIALAKSSGAFVIPTLAVNAGIEGSAESQRFANDARWAPRLSAAQRATLIGSWTPRIANFTLANATSAVRQLRDAGVDVLAGTDAPNPGTAHGVSMHHELELLVRAGLTPVEALAAATSAPARRFALRDRGRIAAGMRADLVLVTGDPSRDILDTRNLDRVWRNGFAVRLGPPTT